MKWDFRCKSKYEIHECKTLKNINEKIKKTKKIELERDDWKEKKEKKRKEKKRKTEIKWMKEKVWKVR